MLCNVSEVCRFTLLQCPTLGPGLLLEQFVCHKPLVPHVEEKAVNCNTLLDIPNYIRNTETS